MKKVQIIKAKLPSYWYADKIDEVFEVYDYPEYVFGEYMYFLSDSSGRIINVIDSKVIETNT